MIGDASQLPDGANIEVDVCIVGAGAAGITLARALRGRGLSIAVLEAGGFGNDDAARAEFHGGEESGPLEVGLVTCRMRHFGGTTNHWSGWTRQLDPDGFEPRAWMPKTGWPIARAQLDPYYKLARLACELGADEWYAEGPAMRSNFELLALDPARVETVLYQYSSPTRFGQRYRAELEDAEDVQVWLHATAIELVMAPGGEAVSRVRCVGPDDAERSFSASATVLALGGIENARLLLASGPIGDGASQVGRGFMEHPQFSAYLAMDGALDLSFYLEQSPVLTADDDGVVETIGRPALALPVAVRRSRELRPSATTFHASSLDEFMEVTGEPKAGELGRFFGLDVEQLQFIRLISRAEQAPLDEHAVSLSSELDAHGVPRVSIHWDVSDDDIESYRRTLRLLGAELARAGVGRLYWDDDPDVFRGALRRGCHHMGTTRMSTSPADGVVDAQCRVHGVANLWIAGSSVFPHAGYANPTLTLVALAYRLAEAIAEELA